MGNCWPPEASDKTIKLWDVAAGALRQTLDGNTDGLYLRRL